MEDRIRRNFNKQGLMITLGARIVSISPGQVEIECPLSDKVTQQNGFIHAGAISSIADSACGYAALTNMPDGADVLCVEFKINFLKPAKTSRIRAIGRVIQAGRKLVVSEAFVYDDSGEKLIAKMTNTLICI